MEKKYNTIVLGGGASGMTAAISAAEHGEKTVIIEKGNRLGRKIIASGNGRCNILNSGTFRYYGDSEFARKILENCTVNDLISFFKRYGLFVKEEKEGRIYPVTMQSISVINMLQNALRINQVEVIYQCRIMDISKQNRFLCKSSDEVVYSADKLIICSGGAAQPKLGGSLDGYQYLQSLGHHLNHITPSLVPVITDKKSISGLSGIRARCTVTLLDRTKIIHRENGEVLFTEYGLSGICVMQCSRFINKQGLHFELDFLSGIFESYNEALSEIKRRRMTFPQFSPLILLEGILLPKISYAVLKQAGIPMRGETVENLSDTDIERIVKTAFQYRVNVINTKSLEDAQVTAGGIRCSDFNPATMESEIVSKLFAAGEVLDVDGDCGGFNLMFAFATGLIAGGFRKSEPFIPEGYNEKR